MEKRRAAIAGLLPRGSSSALPSRHTRRRPRSPGLTSVKHLQRLDISRIGRSVNGPRWLEQDKTVDALVQLQGDPVAVQRAAEGSPWLPADRGRAAGQGQPGRRRAEAGGGRGDTDGRLSTALNALQIRVRVSNLDKVSHDCRRASGPGVADVRPERRRGAVHGSGQDLAGPRGDRRGQVVGLIDTGVRPHPRGLRWSWHPGPRTRTTTPSSSSRGPSPPPR